MTLPYWQFFLAIEADLEKTTRYVELTPDNFATYSVEYARIILSACSEIDVICKMLCEQVSPGNPARNINDYREIIVGRYPQFHSMKVIIPRYGFTVSPWEDWIYKRNLTWWRSYNSVKHERHNFFKEANLKNAVDSVAELFCLVLYYYQPELFTFKLQTWTKLLTVENEPAHLVDNGYTIPDF